MPSSGAGSGRSWWRRSASGPCDSPARTCSDRRGIIERPSACCGRPSARGVDHIDTAQFYGPDVVNELIREALHPYPHDLILVSKVGARRDANGAVLADDEPHQLRRSIEANLRTLGVETLPVVNLRLMRDGEPDALFDDQLGAMMSARDDGLINSIGLSNISHAAPAACAASNPCRVRPESLQRHEPRIAARSRGVHTAGDCVCAVRVARLRCDGRRRRPAATRGRRASGAIGRHDRPGRTRLGARVRTRTRC